jgi:hypothetical protein
MAGVAKRDSRESRGGIPRQADRLTETDRPTMAGGTIQVMARLSSFRGYLSQIVDAYIRAINQSVCQTQWLICAREQACGVLPGMHAWLTFYCAPNRFVGTEGIPPCDTPLSYPLSSWAWLDVFLSQPPPPM